MRISRVISSVTMVMTLFRVLITLLISTHEPPSNYQTSRYILFLSLGLWILSSDPSAYIDGTCLKMALARLSLGGAFGFRVQGCGFRVQGLGVWVLGSRWRTRSFGNFFGASSFGGI